MATTALPQDLVDVGTAPVLDATGAEAAIVDGAVAGGAVGAAESSAVLKLKGLPYSTTEAEIVSFFGDFRVKRVAFVYEPDGRPSGLAFAEFESKEDALKALAKNGEYIGERYVRLLHVPRSEMEEQVRLGTLAIPGNAAKLRSRLMRAQQRSNLTYLSGPLQLVPTVMPGARPLMAVGPNSYSNGMGGQQVGMDNRLWPNTYQNSHAAVALATQQFQNLGLNSGPRGAPGMQQQAQQQQSMGGHNQMLGGVQGQGTQLIPPPRGPMPNPTSATIKVRGLPYRSSPAEILHFFQGYQYLPDSLQIGLDSLGRPSGEAWLTFVTPQEALRTVRDLNRHYLGNRYLELSIC